MEKNTEDDSTTRRLELAWKLVLEQFYEKAKTISSEQGPGISIFRFLREKNRNYNCSYFYEEKDGEFWKILMSESPQGNLVEKLYSPENILICVQIPIGIHGDDTTGTIKLFDEKSGVEIPLVEKELHNPKTPESPGNILRKRK